MELNENDEMELRLADVQERLRRMKELHKLQSNFMKKERETIWKLEE